MYQTIAHMYQVLDIINNFLNTKALIYLNAYEFSVVS